SGGNDAGFGAGEFGEAAAYGALQVNHVDEMAAGFFLSGSDFGKLQGAAEIRPRAAAVDDGFHAEATVDVGFGVHTDCGGGFFVEIVGGNFGEQRRGGEHLHEAATRGFL